MRLRGNDTASPVSRGEPAAIKEKGMCELNCLPYPPVYQIKTQRSGFDLKKEEGMCGYGAFGKAGSAMEHVSSDAQHVNVTAPLLFS